jgi:hypothetical protein
MYTRKPCTSGKCCPLYIKSESIVTEIPIAQDIMDQYDLYREAGLFLGDDDVEIECEKELETLTTDYKRLFALTNTILEKLGRNKVKEEVWWTQQGISSEATGEVAEEGAMQELLKDCFKTKEQLQKQITHASGNVQKLQSRLRALQAAKSSSPSRSPFTQGMSGHQHYPPGYDGRNA